MRRTRALTGPIVLGALLATTPQLALGQDEVGIPEEIFWSVRPGTELQADQLGEYLAKSLKVAFGTDTRPLSAKLRVELVSREEGVVATYESRAGRVEPGRTYDASMWITQPSALDERLAAPLKPAELVIFRIKQKTIVGLARHRIPWECEDATHAVRITLVVDDEPLVKTGQPMICLRAES